ncbi:TPA: hypothetical protein P6M77_001493 [Pseudomonas aeruginosa]|nr:hypothetical protein [Pseudomonas aeruginosa]HDP3259484.1 hypothetical protein [Pseudomonas aeruginosa]HDP3278347.1 hypothetical protein [Pseudomonas aeruginosa]HDP3296812.1 hypothetical protein [Pseudomonas aeruginosa]HDP3301296.1 hypothetical protein [Pseudomonas aeruginosa]HDP3316233.1 hypothetical protein [Pseudomonas aeruginosa]
MPDMREEFEDRFPIPEEIEWRNTDYFPVQTDNVHAYVALAGVAARYTSMWQAWKASRAALRVELPEVGSAPDGAKYDLGFGDPKFAHDYREHQVSAAMRQLCREALQQAGIEVK